MPLTDERRKQLDDIVVKMASQNAPREDVLAIVNDFKSKYDTVTTAITPPISEPGGITAQEKTARSRERFDISRGIPIGIAKEAASRAISGIESVQTGVSSALGFLGLPSPIQKRERPKFIEEGLKPKTRGEEIGAALEKPLEFAAAGAATAGLGVGAGLVGSGFRAALDAGIAASQAKEGEAVQDAAIAALFSGAFSAVGAGVGALKKSFEAGRLAEKSLGLTKNQVTNVNRQLSKFVSSEGK